VNLAINYGSRNEIIDSFKKIKFNSEEINEININKYLSLKKQYPEILIRTGGHRRLSNFLLWQLAYAELFFLKKLWPEFSKKDLVNVINDYKKVKRNFGGV